MIRSIKTETRIFLFVTQQSNSDLGLLIADDSGSLSLSLSLSHTHTHTHTHTHIHTVGLLRTSDQVVAEVATYTTHNKHVRRTSMPSVGFEPAIPPIERQQTYALGRTAASNQSCSW